MSDANSENVKIEAKADKKKIAASEPANDIFAIEVEKFKSNYHKAKPQLDEILGVDTDKYIKFYSNILLEDDNLRQEFIKSDKKNIAKIIRRSQEIAKELAISDENFSLINTIKASHQKISTLQEELNNYKNQLNLNSRPVLRSSNIDDNNEQKEQDFSQIFNR